MNKTTGGTAGISPARAGSTTRPPASTKTCRDQPRTRREHLESEHDLLVIQGSAPHAWGAQVELTGVGLGHGISPARAESTRSRPAATLGRRDQPRTCGEHELVTLIPVVTPGSALHTRGALRKPSAAICTAGISPAHAGGTDDGNRSAYRGRDQPRAREAPLHADTVPAGSGISPTRGGSTRSPAAACPAARDYPRTRGEHDFATSSNFWLKDSAPHVRGALPRDVRGRVGVGHSPTCAGARHHIRMAQVRPGISPARAGSTDSRTSGPMDPRDPPRTRGEHHQKGRRIDPTLGSAPHARGAQGTSGGVSAVCGISPHTAGARAMSTASTVGSGSAPHALGARDL